MRVAAPRGYPHRGLSHRPDIQVTCCTTVSGGSRGGDARAKGGELLSSYSPLPGLKLGYVAAYTQSEFTQLDPGLAAVLKGYQLPQIPKWSMALSGDYDWVLSHAWHAHVGGNLSWVGREWGQTVESRSLGGGPTIEFPSYSVLDLNAGVAKNQFTIKAFARNLTDSRGAFHTRLQDISCCLSPAMRAQTLIMQPRTIGLGVEYLFR